jgi:hypothetical protein
MSEANSRRCSGSGSAFGSARLLVAHKFVPPNSESNTDHAPNNPRNNPLNNPPSIVAKPPAPRMHDRLPLLILAWINGVSLISVGGHDWDEKAIVYQISENQERCSLVDLECLWITIIFCQDGPSPPFYGAVLPLVYPACRICSLFGKGTHANSPVLSRLPFMPA